jgi:hypothetical protein
VTELTKGPTGKPLFKAKQFFDRRGNATFNGVETPFLSAENFEIVKKADPVASVTAAKPADTIIVDASTYKIERVCSSDQLNGHIDTILRKDMNKKLKVFKLDAEVSVGELPVVWKRT